MITEAQSKLFGRLFNYYNKSLFNGKLKDCLFNMDRKTGDYGFFTPERWSGLKNEVIHEINLNPRCLEWKPIEWHAVIVHNMVHSWQYDYGEPSRPGYHNKEFAQKSEEIGLFPSSNGQPGGKRTGQAVRHYFPSGGPFKKEFANLQKKDNKYKPLYGLGSPPAKKDKTGYLCPNCGTKMWGKPCMLDICSPCFELRIPQAGKAGKQAINKNYEMEQEAAKRVLELLREKWKKRYLLNIKEIQKSRNEARDEETAKLSKGKNKEVN